MLHTKPIKILLSTAGDKLGELVRDLPEVADSAVVAESTGRLAAVQTALAEAGQLLSEASEPAQAPTIAAATREIRAELAELERAAETGDLTAKARLSTVQHVLDDPTFLGCTTEEEARKHLEAKKAETA